MEPRRCGKSHHRAARPVRAAQPAKWLRPRKLGMDNPGSCPSPPATSGRRRLRTALLLLPILAAACSDAPHGGAGQGEELALAPAYRAFTLAGDTVTMASLRGAPVLLNLWATWCPPCREEMPSLQRVHEDYQGRGLHVVGVSLDNGEAGAAIAQFVEQYGITFTILHDPHDEATTAFRTFGLPETFLIGPDGRLLRRWRGKVDGDSRTFRKALELAVRPR
jgi:peroxiredoxin